MGMAYAQYGAWELAASTIWETNIASWNIPIVK